MKGFRSLVLQDLPHVFPTRTFQNYLTWSPQLSSLHHTTASSYRFWNFFEFSAKEEPCHGVKKCTSSKQIASPTLLSANEIDSSAKTIALSSNAYQFDLKSTPMTCLKIPKSMKQDNFTSFLDGNPVPATLKWKLKGYKTLRNEQAGDFAFVPGGETYDFDILSKNNRTQSAPVKKSDSPNKTDTLCLTAKAIENKEQLECTKTTNPVEVKEECTKLTNPTEMKIKVEKNEGTSLNISNEQSICEAAKTEVVSNETPSVELALISSSMVKKEEIPILTTSTTELTQTQSSAPYSSRPPQDIQKPSAPVLKQSLNEEKKLTMESNEQKDPLLVSKPSLPTAAEVSEKPTSKESTVKAQNLEDPNPVTKSLEKLSKEETMESVIENKSLDAKPQTFAPVKNSKKQPESTTYFAPRSSKEMSNLSKARKELSQRPNYESIIGIPGRDNVVLKLLNADMYKNMKTSPCAATQARLQQSGGNPSGRNQSAGSFTHNGSSMSGNSGNGSRKPPASYPPFTVRRSSTNSCLTKDLTSNGVMNANGKLDRKSNNVSRISTSSRNSAPRKCDDEDEEPKCNINRRRRRKCEQPERPKCKKEKKSCKRYCCPALQEPVHCDYSKFQCPKNKCGPPIPKSNVERDPTCLPNEAEETREVCTQARRRERSCKRERPCKAERRESCIEEPPCRRRRSCKRQEREDCGQTQDQGREICTKPRRRETCKRQRKCNDRDSGRRSAKCTGRRHYTESAFKNHTKPVANVKRYSSLPAFAFPLIGMRMNAECKQDMLQPTINEKFYGASGCSSMMDNLCRKFSSCSKKDDPCKKEDKCGRKKEDKCKRTTCGKQDTCKNLAGTCGQKKDDPCSKEKLSGICGKKKEDPCKKSKSCGNVCGKKPDPCKTTRGSCGKKDDCGRKCGDTRKSCSKQTDPCDKRGKSGDSCSQKRTKFCQERKKASPSSETESAKERCERERKEMEECKKSIKNKKKKGEKKAAAPGLERVISPCKQQTKNKKGSCKKFAAFDVTYSLINSMSGISVRQLVNVSTNRSYATMRSYSDTDNANNFDANTSALNENNYWMFNENDFSFEELPVPVVIENQEDAQEDNLSFKPNNWFLSWFNANYD